jgi:hypothetical protein
MTREAFRARAGAGRPSRDSEVFLRYLELAKICPEFPFDQQQEIKDRFARSRLSWTRGMFPWATRRFSES